MRLLFTIYHLLIYLDINLVTVTNRYFQNYYCSCYCYYQLCYYCYCTVYCTITVLYYYRLYLSVCSYWQFISLTDTSCLYVFTAYTFHRHQLFCMHLLHIYFTDTTVCMHLLHIYTFCILQLFICLYILQTTILHFTGYLYISQLLAIYTFYRHQLFVCIYWPFLKGSF